MEKSAENVVIEVQENDNTASGAPVTDDQYETKQELEKIKDQINGVMESVTTMTETIGKKFDAMAREKAKRKDKDNADAANYTWRNRKTR